jgi:hypothetical protein
MAVSLPLSYGAVPADKPLIEATISAFLDETAARYPDHEALVRVASRRRWTYTGLTRDVDRLRPAWSRRGRLLRLHILPLGQPAGRDRLSAPTEAKTPYVPL